MAKKILAVLLLFTMIFGISIKIKADANPPEGEIFLWSTKTGVARKVYHYGTAEPVTLPSQYFTAEAEMRGVWVATVYNIAIGKQRGTSPAAIQDYKNEFISILNRMEEFGMNTLFFQIRPNNDAFYKSELNPWSEFLVGAGVDPGWDPLEWMIDETHKRGFDFQCWMNAYRVTTSSYLPDSNKIASNYTNDEIVTYKQRAIAGLAEGNFAKLHPEYVVAGESDTRLILNPSEIAVQDFIVATLKEIVENYDIDGMHFDDYFYLNGTTSSDTTNTNFAGGTTYDAKYSGINTLNDLGNYQEYLNNSSKYAHMERGYTLGEFRRENVNVMMRRIRAMVDEYNSENGKHVEYGSKPAAVWRSNIEYCSANTYRCIEGGSNTDANAYSSYSDLFADTWKWVEEGLVDYVAPQVYYAFEDNIASYGDIVLWWAEKVEALNVKRAAENLKPIKLYIAHGIYKYRDAPSQFYNPSEIFNQIKYNQKFASIQGSAFYSYETLYEFASTTHETGVRFLRTNWSKALVYPLSRGIDDSEGLKINDYSILKDTISEKYSITFDSIPKSRVYGIYKVAKGETLDTSDVESRILVKYSPYVENSKVTLRIDEYDDAYDYYLKVVSTNGYVSNETTKLDFTDVSSYESITINNVTPIDYEILRSQIVKITADVVYLDGGSLSYKIKLLEDGREKSEIASGNVTNNKISFNYEAYSYNVSNVSLKIEVSNGEFTKSYETNKFNIVNRKTQPNVTGLNNLQSVLFNNSEVGLQFSVFNSENYEYGYRVFVVNNDNAEKTLISEGTSTNTTLDVNWAIANSGITSGKILIETTYNNITTTYQSSNFTIVELSVFVPNSIVIDKTNPAFDEKVKLAFDINSEYNDAINYSIWLDDGTNTIGSAIYSNNTFDHHLEYTWTCTNVNAKKVRFKIVITNGSSTIVDYSDYMNILIPSYIVDDKVNLSSNAVKKNDTLNVSFVVDFFEGSLLSYNIWAVDSNNNKLGDALASGTIIGGQVNAECKVSNISEKTFKILVEVTGETQTTSVLTSEVNIKGGCGSCASKSSIALITLISMLSAATILIRKKQN